MTNITSDFTTIVQREEFSIEISNLLAAVDESVRTDGKLFFCRKTIECIAKSLHYNHFGQFPDEKSEWKFSTIMKKIRPKISSEISRKIWGLHNSISGMREIHWTPEYPITERQSDEKINVIKKQIVKLGTQIHGPIIESNLLVNDNQFTNTIRRAISEELPQSDALSSRQLNSDNLTHAEEVDLDEILSVAEISENLGVKLDPNQIIKLGIAADLRGSPFSAEGYFRQALELFREYGNKRGEGLAINNLALVYETRGDLEQAKIYFHESLDISILLDNKKDQGMILNNLGMIARDEGELESAQKFVQKSLEIRKEIGDKRGEGMCYTALGRIADTWGDWKLAEKFFSSAIELYIHVDDSHGEGLALGNLGNAAKAREDYEEATMYYQHAKQVFTKGNHSRDLAITICNLGYIACQQENITEAEKLHLESLKILRKIGYRTGETHPLIGLGLIHQLRGDLNQSEFYFQQALSVSRETNNRQAEAIILNNLGWLSLEHQEHVIAEGYFRESVRINNQIGIPLDEWYIDNGFTNPDSKWDFPPQNIGDSKESKLSK